MKLSRSKTTYAPLVVLGLFILALFLPQVFSGNWVLPQFFSIGPITIHYYGITMALAVASAWWLASKRAPQYGLTQEQVDTLSLWLVVGGLIGARLYHIASSWQYYWQYPLEALKIWHGGLSIFGALLGGFIVLLFSATAKNKLSISTGGGTSVIASDALRTKQSNTMTADEIAASQTPRNDKRESGVASSAPIQHSAFNILHLLDWLAPSVLLGQIIGRFGNFFNYEAFGYPTNLPWKMFVPEYFRPSEYISALYFHPLFLYEALGNTFIFLGLLYFFRANRIKKSAKPVPAGALFFSYLILYNVLRFALEHLRIDSTFLVYSIRLNALVSGFLVVLSAAGLYWLQKRANGATAVSPT